jgi:alkylated DNA nucleotide flippase Atl1
VYATTRVVEAATRATKQATARIIDSAREQVGAILETIAAGTAYSYTDTSDSVGQVKACKKGDGVLEGLSVEPGTPAPRVVVELTTQSHARNWQQYLEIAERNRDAQASIGLVPSRDLVPGREFVAVIGPGRMVLAFDPDCDEQGLLRATLQLLLVQAQRRLAEDRGAISVSSTASSTRPGGNSSS